MRNLKLVFDRHIAVKDQIKPCSSERYFIYKMGMIKRI